MTIGACRSGEKSCSIQAHPVEQKEDSGGHRPAVRRGLVAGKNRSGKTRRHRPKHETYPTLKAYGNFLDNREDYLRSEPVLLLVSYKQRSCRLGSFASHAKHDASISHSVIPEKDTDSRFNRSSNQESGLLRRRKQSDC